MSHPAIPKSSLDGWAKAATKSAPAASGKPRKLSFKEQRELDELPGRIEAMEVEQQSLSTLLADGAIYSSDADRAALAQARYAKLDADLLAALERWEALGAR